MRIEIKELCKEIRGVAVLDHINVTFQGGTVYGLQGRNGSGKTMLMRAISGLIFPTKGTITINGEVLHRDIEFPKSIGILIENPAFLPEFSGLKNLKMLADIGRKVPEEEIKRLLFAVGLDPEDKRAYYKYSLGMKQKLGIACAFMGDPELILLDEPINALDDIGVQNVRVLLNRAKKRGALVILACHDQEELKSLSDVILKVADGRIVSEMQKSF